MNGHVLFGHWWHLYVIGHSFLLGHWWFADAVLHYR